MAEVVTQQTSTQVEAVLGAMAQEFKTSERDILRQALRALLQHALREVNAQIFAITGRYDITSVAEMDARYQAGTLEEADSWRDLQQLDHLEYKRDRLTEFLEALA
jgi:23S rRNA maturation mini-RNase III